MVYFFFFFFFQAEDGIRDHCVTGVQTCALPISSLPHRVVRQARGLLDAVDGVANEEIGRRCGVSANTVRAWRKSVAERGVAGVGVVAEGRGRKPWLPEG